MFTFIQILILSPKKATIQLREKLIDLAEFQEPQCDCELQNQFPQQAIRLVNMFIERPNLRCVEDSLGATQ